MDLYGLQLQAARTIVESGAVIARRRWRKASDRLPVPFQIQVLEPDYIDPSKHGPLDSAPGVQGGFVVNGVQFNPIGKREGILALRRPSRGGSRHHAGFELHSCRRILPTFSAPTVRNRSTAPPGSPRSCSA
jgi:hypothetical protein